VPLPTHIVRPLTVEIPTESVSRVERAQQTADVKLGHDEVERGVDEGGGLHAVVDHEDHSADHISGSELCRSGDTMGVTDE
jgi:hypothetical protein